jgi:hypothetical protein
LVPLLLAFAIPFDGFGMFRAVVRKIVGMSFAPLLLAVVGDLTIVRICFELPSVIVGTSPALALPIGCRRLAVDGRESEEKYTCSRDSSRSRSRRLLKDLARRISEK